ncbi:MAG: 4-hydroxy-tetrahydrodipicolinate reductase [Myxococcaceae bacterium]
MAPSPIKTVITGVSGRMGSLLTRLIRDTADFSLHGATDKPGSAAIGLDAGLAAHLAPLEVTTVDALDQALQGAQVVIDFTTPEVSVQHAKLCANAGVPLVVGSTGFSADAKGLIAESAKRVPIVMSPNMSVGVNLVIELAAAMARRLGEGFDVEIVETHHRMKKDAPSGTAVRLAEELAKSLGRPNEVIRTSRVGQIGERKSEEIGVQALRGGDVVGEHTVYFFGDGERVELTHRATSREQFGRGALRAARWVLGKPAGLYDMTHVLGVNG